MLHWRAISTGTGAAVGALAGSVPQLRSRFAADRNGSQTLPLSAFIRNPRSRGTFVPEEFGYPPEDPFIYFGALDPPEQHAVIAELAASAKDRSSLIHELAEVFPGVIQLLKPVDERGIRYNSPQLTLIDPKSILYMTQFADPKASRTELAARFGVSRQRISQIIGAHGGSKADAGLLRQFKNTSAEQLRDCWRVEADMQALAEYRAGRRAGSPLRPRNMTREVNPLGRWSAYGYQFEICERSRLYYFRIDVPDEDESNPRNSAKQALGDCFAICRELAWANSSGSHDEWELTYREDPTGPANSKNLIRLGD
jgi:hypothetical protein